MPDLPRDIEGAARDWTCSQDKLDAYLREPGFIGSARRFRDITDLQQFTMCVLKPEAVAGRRLRDAMSIFEEADFVPVFGTRFRYTPSTLRSAWFHNLNIATPERLVAMEAVLTSTDSLLVVLRDRRWRADAPPAAARFTSLKGPSDPERRTPVHLRHRLGVVNGLFNFVHSSDEPIDVVREVDIVLDEEASSALLKALREGRPASGLSELMAELEREVRAHDLDLELSLARLRGSLDDAARQAVDTLAASAASPGPEQVEKVLRLSTVRPGDEGLRWDLMTLVSCKIECNIPGVRPMIPTIGLCDYQRRAGNG